MKHNIIIIKYILNSLLNSYYCGDAYYVRKIPMPRTVDVIKLTLFQKKKKNELYFHDRKLVIFQSAKTPWSLEFVHFFVPKLSKINIFRLGLNSRSGAGTLAVIYLVQRVHFGIIIIIIIDPCDVGIGVRNPHYTTRLLCLTTSDTTYISVV